MPFVSPASVFSSNSAGSGCVSALGDRDKDVSLNKFSSSAASSRKVSAAQTLFPFSAQITFIDTSLQLTTTQTGTAARGAGEQRS